MEVTKLLSLNNLFFKILAFSMTFYAKLVRVNAAQLKIII